MDTCVTDNLKGLVQAYLAAKDARDAAKYEYNRITHGGRNFKQKKQAAYDVLYDAGKALDVLEDLLREAVA